ncbi:myb-like protein I [Physella acuta]|uniref:myb-like protein I n=1 Tax=Physella acuta TaxID=109671 RepID=UPI0027DC2093|nr:myb-like protein I [Physella acuta]
MQYQAPTYDDDDHTWFPLDEHENESPLASPAQSFPPSVVSDERYDNWPQAPTPSPGPCTPLVRSCHTPYPDNSSFFTNTPTPEKEITTSTNRFIEEDENSNVTLEDFLNEDSSNLQQLIDLIHNSANNNTYNNTNSTCQEFNSTGCNLNNTFFNDVPFMPETKQPSQEPTTFNRKRRNGINLVHNNGQRQASNNGVYQEHTSDLDQLTSSDLQQMTTSFLYEAPPSDLDQMLNSNLQQMTSNVLYQVPTNGIDQMRASDLDQTPSADLQQITTNVLYHEPTPYALQLPKNDLNQAASDNTFYQMPKDIPQKPTFGLPQKPTFDLPQKPTFDLPQKPTFELPQSPTFDLHQKPTSGINTSGYCLKNCPVSPATSYVTHPPSLPPAEASTPTSPPYHMTTSAQILEPQFPQNLLTTASSSNPGTQEPPNSHNRLGYEQFNSTKIVARTSNGISNSDLECQKTYPKQLPEPPVLPSAVDAEVDSYHSLKLGDVDPSLAAATIQYLNTGNGFPMVKYELKQKILLNLSLKGKDDVILHDPAPKEYELTQEEIEKRDHRKELNRKSAANYRQSLKAKQQEAEEKLQVEEKRHEVLQEACQKMLKEKEEFMARLLNLGISQEIINLHLSMVGLHGPVVQNGPGQSRGHNTR